MGLLKILFIIALSTFPFGEIIRFEILKGVALNLNSIVLVILAAYWIIYHLVKKTE